MPTASGAGTQWWTSTSASTLVPVQVTTADDAAGSVAYSQLPGVMVSRLSGSGGEFARTTGLISDHPGNSALFSLALRGELHVSDGAPTRAGATAFCFGDRPYAIGTDADYDVLTVRVPLGLLPARLEDLKHASPLSTDHDQLIGVLRQTALAVLSRERRDAFERRTFADLILGLLSLVVTDGTARRSTTGSRAATFEAATELIDRHHHDPMLSIDELARRCHVSRRELELAFAGQGLSPASYIRQVRLRAARILLDEDESRATMSSLAHRVGFADVTTFTRSFRREFGTTPHRWRSEYAMRDGEDGQPRPR